MLRAVGISLVLKESIHPNLEIMFKQVADRMGLSKEHSDFAPLNLDDKNRVKVFIIIIITIHLNLRLVIFLLFRSFLLSLVFGSIGRTPERPTITGSEDTSCCNDIRWYPR